MRLLCKNDNINFRINNIPLKITVGKHYYFSHYTNTTALTYKLDGDDNGNCDFFFFKEDCPPYIWKYFYTPQEERNLKLQQLETAL